MLDLTKLSGTSSEKVAQLVAQLRGDGQSSLMLWACQKVPFGIGDTIKWLVDELPRRDAQDVDQMIDQVIAQVRTLQSDGRPEPCELHGGHALHGIGCGCDEPDDGDDDDDRTD